MWPRLLLGTETESVATLVTPLRRLLRSRRRRAVCHGNMASLGSLRTSRLIFKVTIKIGCNWSLTGVKEENARFSVRPRVRLISHNTVRLQRAPALNISAVSQAHFVTVN